MALLAASILAAAGVKLSDKDRLNILEMQISAQDEQNKEFVRIINILIARTEDLNDRVKHFEDQDINDHENNEKAKF